MRGEIGREGGGREGVGGGSIKGGRKGWGGGGEGGSQCEEARRKLGEGRRMMDPSVKIWKGREDDG